MTALGLTRGFAALTALAKAAFLPNRRLPHIVAPIGDSRVEALYLDGGQRNRNARSPLNVANSLLGHRLVIGDGWGKSGDRTDQFFARLPAAIASGAGTLYVQGGVNNLGQTATGFTYTHAKTGEIVTIDTVAAVTFRDLREIAEAARAAGMIVVIENEIGGNGLTTAEKIAALMSLRQLIAEYGDRTPGVFVHDSFASVMQPGTTTPTFKTLHAYDGTHENARGAYWHAKSLARLLGAIVPAGRSVLSRGMLDVPANGRRQLLANHLFLTTTGGTAVTGITGNVPASFATSLTNATATLSTAANADGIGNGLQMAVDFSAAGMARLSQALNGTGAGAYHATVSAGDVLEAVAEVEIVGNPTVLAGVSLELAAFSGTGGALTLSTDQVMPGAPTANDVGINEPAVLTLRTRAVVVPAAVGAFPYVTATIRVATTAAGSATVIVRQLAVRRRVAA